jgi:hypothetical protein
MSFLLVVFCDAAPPLCRNPQQQHSSSCGGCGAQPRRRLAPPCLLSFLWAEPLQASILLFHLPLIHMQKPSSSIFTEEKSSINKTLILDIRICGQLNFKNPQKASF